MKMMPKEKSSLTIFEIFGRVAHNVEGFVQAGDLENVQPGTKAKYMFKSPLFFQKPNL
jgi:hypothetical protein